MTQLLLGWLPILIDLYTFNNKSKNSFSKSKDDVPFKTYCANYYEDTPFKQYADILEYAVWNTNKEICIRHIK